MTVDADAAVKVLNAQGACVYAGNVEAGVTAQLSLNLAAGVYIVSVENEKGITTQKLVVK